LIQKLPDDFVKKVVWGSRYGSILARMLGGNAAEQFGVDLAQKVNG
jgi:hypothetical protein